MAVAPHWIYGVAGGAGIDDERLSVERDHHLELVVVGVAADAALAVATASQRDPRARRAQDVHAADGEARGPWQVALVEDAPPAVAIGAEEERGLLGVARAA